MSGDILFPRLPKHVAHKLAQEHAHRDVDALLRFVEDVAPDYSRIASYRATGGTRASSSQLAEVCAAVRESARMHGYPGGVRDRAAADSEMAIVLHQRMRIVPSDAAHPGVWAFMACVQMPDIVAWRYRGEREVTADVRYLGGVRNTFGRLWWRAHTMVDPTSSAPYALVEAGLSEDNWVQLMERPGLYGYGPLARCIVTTLLATRSATVRRQDVMRDACKRLSRIRSVASFELMDDPDLACAVGQCFEEALAAVGGSAVPRE